MYPYRIRVTDPIEIEIFKNINKHRVVKIKSNLAKSIGHKIPRKIKRDGFFIQNGRIGIDNPRLNLDIEPVSGKRKGINAVLKSIF
jgi:hypothetical protein